MRNVKKSLLAPALLFAAASVSRGAILFSDNFNVNSSASWTVNVAPAANAAQQSAQFAFGTSGTVPIVVGNTGLASGASMDAIGFATTGDGGITSDYRVYPKSGTISTAASGVYAAGTANDTNNATPMANTNLFYQGIP